MPYMDVLKIDVTILAGRRVSKNLKHVRHPLISEHGHVTPVTGSLSLEVLAAALGIGFGG